MKLLELLDKLNINGGERGTDKEVYHSYISTFYEDEFAKYQDKEIRLLEIGVQHGASIRLWREYFTNAHIVGVDNKSLLLPDFNMTGIEMHIANAYDNETVKMLGEFDIIIDDGSHQLYDQIAVLDYYLPHLNPGGLLVIEDVYEICIEPLVNHAKKCLVPDEDVSVFQGEGNSTILAIKKSTDVALCNLIRERYNRLYCDTNSAGLPHDL